MTTKHSLRLGVFLLLIASSLYAHRIELWSSSLNDQRSFETSLGLKTAREHILGAEKQHRHLAKSQFAQDGEIHHTDFWQYLRDSFELEYSKPDDPQIVKYEKFYSAHPKYFERFSKRAYWYLPYILEEIEKRRLPADLAIVPIIESNVDPSARSSSNAVGVWQIIASTGERRGLRQDWWIDERKDIVESTQVALDYLSFLHEEFDHDWELALASYNAGASRVRDAISANLKANRPTTYPYLKLPKETKSYLPKFIAIRNIVSEPEKYNIPLPPIPKSPTIVVVDPKTQTDLRLIATMISISPNDLMNMNSGYLRGVTPPQGPYHMIVPKAHAPKLMDILNESTPGSLILWHLHRVRRGEDLQSIAALYNTEAAVVKRLNNLESEEVFLNQALRIPKSLNTE